MSFSLGSVIAYIKADLSDFNRGIAEAKTGMASMRGSIVKVNESLADFRNAGRTALAATTVVAGLFGKTMLDAAAANETNLTAFTTLLGDSEKAYKFVEQVKKDAIATPFQQDGLIQMNQLLIGSGINAETSRKTVLMLGDALAATGKGNAEMSRIGVTISQIFGKGKADAIDFKELVNAGWVSVKQDVSDTLGVTVTQLEEMVTNGEVGFEDLQKTLKSVTGEGGKFFDAMNRQSLTFTGRLGTLVDTLNIVGGEIFVQSGAFDAFKNALGAFSDLIVNNKESIIAFFKGIGQGIQTMVPYFLTFGKWVMDNKDPIIAFLTSFGAGLAALYVVSEIIALITLLTNPITLVVAAIVALFWAYNTNFLGIRDIVNSVGTWMVDFFNNYLLPYLTYVYNWWKDNWNATAMVFRGAWLLIQGIVQLFVGIVGTAIKVFLALMHGDFKGAWKAIQDGWGLMWEGVKKIFEGAINMLAGFAGTILHWLVSPFEDAWKKINETMGKIRDALDFTKRHSPSVIDLINRGVSLANNAFDKLEMPTIPSIVQDVSQGIRMAQVTLNLDGALIANDAAALEIGELIGDSIIKKLQMTIRT